MTLCEQCGAELPENANYCSNCGRQVGTGGPNAGPPGWLLLVGAITGAFTAVIIGYVLSLTVLKVLFAVVGRGVVDPQGLAVLDSISPRLAGLSYLSGHHIALNGFSRGGVFLSLLLPVWTWTVVAAAAVITGGWISASVSQPSSKRDVIAASMVCAGIYVALLIVLRQPFSVDASALNQIPFGRVQPSFPPVILSASIRSLFLEAGLLSLLLFAFGHLIISSRMNWTTVKKFLTGRGFLPAWASGALLAIVIGQLVLMSMLLLWGGLSAATGAQPAAMAAFLLAPAAAGITHYFYHGIPITAASSAGFGDSTASHLYTLSLFRGFRELVKFPGEPWKVLAQRPVPTAMWAGLIIAAFSVILAAYLTYRNRDLRESPLLFSLKMASVYTILLLIGISFYSFTMNAADVAPGLTGLSRVSIKVAPATWQTLVMGWSAGFLYSLAGSMLAARRRVSPEPSTASEGDGE